MYKKTLIQLFGSDANFLEILCKEIASVVFVPLPIAIVIIAMTQLYEQKRVELVGEANRLYPI